MAKVSSICPTCFSNERRITNDWVARSRTICYREQIEDLYSEGNFTISTINMSYHSKNNEVQFRTKPQNTLAFNTK